MYVEDLPQANTVFLHIHEYVYHMAASRRELGHESISTIAAFLPRSHCSHQSLHAAEVMLPKTSYRVAFPSIPNIVVEPSGTLKLLYLKVVVNTICANPGVNSVCRYWRVLSAAIPLVNQTQDYREPFEKYRVNPEAESHHMSRDTRHPLLHRVAEMSYNGDIYIRPPAPCTELAMHLLEMDKLVWVEAESQREDHNARECSSKFSEGALVLSGKAAAAIEPHARRCNGWGKRTANIDREIAKVRGDSSEDTGPAMLVLGFGQYRSTLGHDVHVPHLPGPEHALGTTPPAPIRESHSLVTEPMQIKAILRNPRSRMAKCLNCAVAASGTENSISSPSSRVIRTIERKKTEDAARRMKWDGTPMKDGSETTVWIALLNPYESLFQCTGGVIELPIRRTQSNSQVVDVRPEARELGKSSSGSVECWPANLASPSRKPMYSILKPVRLGSLAAHAPQRRSHSKYEPEAEPGRVTSARQVWAWVLGENGLPSLQPKMREIGNSKRVSHVGICIR
ncbi:hypothetical protein C8J57DRAFT_1233647 [Mycena rebaudengoi]|nr:hypothetical protein C8J57DRAFT_1233647 [Mycena rebaudengoi]